MKRALLLKYDDWQALYVDGSFITSSHEISVEEMMMWSEKLNFRHSDIIYQWASKEDGKGLEELGEFPEKQSELKGEYK